MIKLNKDLLLATTLIAAIAGFTGCTTTTTNTANTANSANKTNSANTSNSVNTSNTTSTSNTANSSTTASADKLGIPECDDYIEKYEACINSKVPEAQRAALNSSFETMRKSWKAAAANPQAKAALASGCKQAHDSAKQAMSAYSCVW